MAPGSPRLPLMQGASGSGVLSSALDALHCYSTVTADVFLPHHTIH